MNPDLQPLLTTNLLPPEDQKAVKRTKIAVAITTALWALAGFAALNGILLLPTYFPVSSEEKGLKNALKIEEELERQSRLRKTIDTSRKLKSDTDRIQKFLSLNYQPSPILNVIHERAGKDIEIETTSLTDGERLSLVGLARTRVALLAFEKSLRESGYFQTITSPLTNYTREDNINFSIQAQLAPAFRLQNNR